MQPYRVVVVVPTFNNARTLPQVLGALRDTGLPVIAVDDGCTDETATILRGWLGDISNVVIGRTLASVAPPALLSEMQGGKTDKIVRPTTEGKSDAALREVVTHPRNRGKAAALRSGFARAGELGFTHALTIDSDGQHDVADVAPLVRLSVRQPGTLVVGARPTATRGYPAASRVGRAISNAFVRLESGATVSDSQCGLRVYPLDAVAKVRAGAARYGFETEVITRLAWAGVPVLEAPIRCVYDVPGGRVSHFRPFIDSVQATGIHVRLVTRALMPWPVRKLTPVPDDDKNRATGTIAERMIAWMNPLTVWRKVRRDAGERKRLAASMAVGIFVATIPAYGVKTLLCLGLAKWLRLQPLVVLAVSSLNTPPTGLLLVAMSIATGHVLLHGTLPDVRRYDPWANGFWPTFKSVAAEWVVGGVVTGAALALIAYAVVTLMMRAMPLAPTHPNTRHATA